MSKKDKERQYSVIIPAEALVKAKNKALNELRSGELAQRLKVNIMLPFETDINKVDAVNHWRVKDSKQNVFGVNLAKKEITLEEPVAQIGNTEEEFYLLPANRLNEILSYVYGKGIEFACNEMSDKDFTTKKIKLLQKAKNVQIESATNINPMFNDDAKDCKNYRLMTAMRTWNLISYRLNNFIENSKILKPIKEALFGIFKEIENGFIDYVVNDLIKKPLKGFLVRLATSLINSFMGNLGNFLGFAPPLFSMAI